LKLAIYKHRKSFLFSISFTLQTDPLTFSNSQSQAS
jgi:hypothetical protein